MSPNADPDPSGSRVTNTGAGWTKPANAHDDKKTSVAAIATCFIFDLIAILLVYLLL
jgi:hypothetical protein